MAEPRKLGLYRTTTRTRALMMLVLDIFGYGLLWPWTLWRRFQGRRYHPEKVKNIAVLRLDGIGDLVLSSRGIQLLRRAFPGAVITLFVNKWSDGVAQMIPGVDEVICLDAPFFSSFKQKSNWTNLLKERKRLKNIGKEQRFDLAIDLRGDFFSILEALWLDAKWLMARSSRAGGFLLTNRVIQHQEGFVSEEELNTAFMAIVSHCDGCFLETEPASVVLNVPHLKSSVVENLGYDYICMAVAAPYESRCYPPRLWLKLIELLRREYPKPIAILGSPSEAGYCGDIADKAGGGVYSLAGRLSLEESVACIKGCRLFIGNDGGLIHIASALKRPVIQLFGPASSTCFGHFGIDEHVIQKRCPYNPCPENRCRMPDQWCMGRIAPEEVFLKSRKYLM